MPKLPTLRGVNLLYLLTMVLVVTAGAALQAWSPAWGLILTEFLVILPPALLFLLLNKLPVRDTLRLRWPGTGPAAYSLLIGLGFGLLALWLGNLVIIWFGYSFALPPGFFPNNLAQALVIFAGFSISAPICEETFFRGVLQRGYERLGPGKAIVFTGLLFAVYHLSFERLVALIPVALVLGYVAWRSNSLVSSMLVHFSYNALSTVLLIIGSLRPDLTLGFFGSASGAALGIVLGVLGLWLLRRDALQALLLEPAGGGIPESPAPVEISAQELSPANSAAAPGQADRPSWIGRFWPLGVAFLIYLALAGFEFLLGRDPGALASTGLKLAPAPWQGPVHWTYELHNVLDESVGQAECSLQPESSNYLLDCQVHQEAFKAQKGHSTYQTDAFEFSQQVAWTRNSLALTQAEASQMGNSLSLTYRLSPQNGGLLLAVGASGTPTETLDLPADALLAEEWPWRLSALPFTLGSSWKVTLGWPSRWSDQAQRSLPSASSVVVNVLGAEPVATPAGRFIAWKVKVGDQTAWYDAQPPHTLVRYDNGIESYLLSEIR